MDGEKDVVLITGCTDGGLGAAMALEFVKTGCRVVATSRSVATMKEISTHDNIHPRALDVTDYAAAKACVESVVAEFGQIDILVNNAGVPCVAPIAEIPLSNLEMTFKTNVFGPIVLVQAVVPHMAARRKGRIVNVGSIVSLAYGPWAGGYISSKAALEALNDALRLELKPFGIDVVLIMPGAIMSNIGKVSIAGLQSWMLDGLKLYKPFEPELCKRAKLAQTPKSTPTVDFAKITVARIVAKSPPVHFVYGRFGTLFCVLHYIPLFIRDRLAAAYFGLNRKVSVTSDKKTD